MKIILPVHNIQMINLSDVITTDTESKILNDLDSFNLIKDGQLNIKHRDTKRLMYHHVIHDVCVYVLSLKRKERAIIYYDTSSAPTSQLNSFTSEPDLILFFTALVRKISKMLPIKFICTDISFNRFRVATKSKDGVYHDVLNHAKDILTNYDISKYTFTVARGFAKRHGLDYLSNNFFQKIKTKQLLLM